MELKPCPNYSSSSVLQPISIISSTAHLTENEAQAQEKRSDEYDPFSNRQVTHPNTDLGALAHFLKCSLGSGILAMPNAFRNAGLVVGMVLTFTVGFVCTHCVHILVKSSHSLCRKGRVPVLNYAETAEYAFLKGTGSMPKWANFARKFVDWGLVTAYYSVCCVYLVFASTSFKQVADVYFKDCILDIRVYIVIVMVPALLMSLIRNLQYLVPFSTIANAFIVVSFGITLYYIFKDAMDFSDIPLAVDVTKLPLFFSTVIFAMEGIGVVMPVENSMKNPSHFLGCPGVLNTAMFIVISLYSIIGFFGYVRYGNTTMGSITLNLPVDELLAQTVKILIGLAILFTYPLQFYVATQITMDMLQEKVSKERLSLFENCWRIITVILTGCMAIAVPNLGPIISLVGAVFFALLGLLFPAVIEIATYFDGWEGGLGRYKWILYKDIVIILFATLALVFGTYTSIIEIIDAYSTQ